MTSTIALPPGDARRRALAYEALATHWHVALDTAEAAVAASLRAQLLPPDFCTEELRHLRAESAWLEQAPFA